MPPAPPNFSAPPTPQLEIWPNYRPPLVGPLRTSALYCTSSALSPEETPEFPRNFTESTIVGYQTSNITGGIYYMIAAQFDEVTGNGAGIAIKDLVTGNVPYGAEMQVRLPAGDYDVYNYIADAYDADLDDFVPGWADKLGDLATAPIAPGAAFWFKTDTACNVNIAGKILEDSSKTVNVNAGIFSMIANAYPADVNPNAVTWTGLTYGDEMQVRLDAGDYDIYKYIEDAYDADLDDFVPGWADKLGDLVTTGVLKAGRGAWIKPTAAVSVTWESPIQ